jgi:hypothetical protein
MSEFKGDKRTKEYKEWKKKHDAASGGLGDTVEKITTATGVKKAVKFIAGEDCGCDERKTLLNELYSYHKPECLTEEEYEYLAPRIGRLNNIQPQEQYVLLKIYNRVFNDNVEPTNCGKCFKNEVWSKLEKLFKTYS